LPYPKESEFLNSIEASLFGEFSNKQAESLPAIRLKQQDWLELICFRPFIDSDQMHQAAVLSSDKNWVDECLAHFMELLNCQDMKSINSVLEALALIQS
jgi:hypothetical protein